MTRPKYPNFIFRLWYKDTHGIDAFEKAFGVKWTLALEEELNELAWGKREKPNPVGRPKSGGIVV